MSSLQRFKKRIVQICIVITIVHVLACLYISFFPLGPMRQTRIGVFYRTRVLLGPFFMADRLKRSPHFLVSYKPLQGDWSVYRDDAVENLTTYRTSPWRYDKLTQADILRYLGRQLYMNRNSDSLLQRNELAVLNTYISKAVFSSDKIDSVKLVYIWNIYDVKSNTIKPDTVWTFSYKLNDDSVR